MPIQILPAQPAHAPELIRVQNLAFRADHLRYGFCPGYGHTVERMEAIIRDPCHRAYRILLDGETVGDLLVGLREECHFLGCLCVIPEHQGEGIGSAAMAFLLEEFPHAQRWDLVTPDDKPENHRFYEKHGFHKMGTKSDRGVTVALFRREGGRAGARVCEKPVEPPAAVSRDPLPG